MAHGTVRDPRSVVTPDAFEVSPELLGLRLAPPSRRLWAILVDLVVVALLAGLTRSFALILGVVAAVAFIRVAFKRTPVRGSVFDRAMRASVGCLGVLIALTTAALWIAFGPTGGRSNDDDETLESLLDVRGDASSLGRAFPTLARVAAGTAFRDAETLAEAEAAARGIVEAARELSVPAEETRTALLEAVPSGAPWAGEAPALFERLLGPAATTPESIEPRDLIAIADEVSLYATEEALEAYLAILRDERGGELDLARRRALEVRLVSDLGADTLRILETTLTGLRQVVAEQQEDLSELEDELEAAESRGLFAWVRRFLDELGFGFGWASLYLTVALSWWNGRTVGKKLLGIRVLRLDGRPITWWVAFERAGGYAAGFATGLLGFAQIYWDANRQAIHDRIVGTVVVLDTAEKVLNWESTP